MKNLYNYKECVFVQQGADMLIINRSGLCVSTLSLDQLHGLISAGLLVRSRVIDNAIVYRIAS